MSQVNQKTSQNTNTDALKIIKHRKHEETKHKDKKHKEKKHKETKHKDRKHDTYKQTKSKLIISYTLIIGTIITIISILVLNYIWKMRIDNQRAEVEKNVNDIADKLRYENIISNDWISRQELNQNYILHIEDNGNAIKQYSSWIPNSERQRLFAQAMERNIQYGVDIHTKPKRFNSNITTYGTLPNESGEDYYLATTMIPLENSMYRSFILLQNFPENREFRKRLVVAGGGGLFLLWILFYGINYFFITIMHRPIDVSRKQQTEFIACASHELKAPLAVIQSSCSALCANPEKMMRYSDHIQSECTRMGQLVDDLLLLASTENNKWRLKLEKVEVDTLLLEVFDSYEAVCISHGMKLKICIGEEFSQPILADEERLTQVLIILLNNAIQYSKSEKPIELMKKESKNYIYLMVVDHGIGIDQEKQAHIFEKFYRVDQSHHSKENYGLGLSIAKELIRLQGGVLSYMETDGGGATFSIKLPK